MECRSRNKIKARGSGKSGCSGQILADKDKDTDAVTHQLLYKVLQLLEEPSKSTSASSSACNCQPLLKRVLDKCTELERSLEVINQRLMEATTTKCISGGNTKIGAPALSRQRKTKIASANRSQWEDSDLNWNDNDHKTGDGDRMDTDSDFGGDADGNANDNAHEHDDTKPYLCKLCPISFYPKPIFSDPRGLAEHYTSQHQIPEPAARPGLGPNVQLGREDCDFTDALVPASRASAHVLDVNAPPEDYVGAGLRLDNAERFLCDECGGDYQSRDSLKAHKIRIHGAVRGSCKIVTVSKFQSQSAISKPGPGWKRSGRGKELKWRRVTSFPDADSAFAALKAEKIWRKRLAYTTKASVLKETYDCKMSRQCRARAMLHFTNFRDSDGDGASKSPSQARAQLVTIYKTDAAHNHDLQILDERKNGILSDVKKLVAELLDEGLTKPTLIMDELATRTRGAKKLPSRRQLVNYLGRVKRERGLTRKAKARAASGPEPDSSVSTSTSTTTATLGLQHHQMRSEAQQGFIEAAVTVFGRT